MRATAAAICILIVCLTPGCPDSAPGALEAIISTSVTSGPAPLTVVASSSASGPADAIVSRQWDFAGEATATTMQATHTFVAPGRYPIDLRVVAADGAVATARTTVRVAGAAPTAVLEANRTIGFAPLAITFDATASSAPDDVIFDFFWDFADGDTSRLDRVTHVFDASGVFDVTLRVVTAGGVEDLASLRIEVAPPPASQPTTQPATQPAPPPATQPAPTP